MEEELSKAGPSSISKRGKVKKIQNTIATVQEDPDSIMEMEVDSFQQREFPSPSDDDMDSVVEGMQEGEVPQSQNNNAAATCASNLQGQPSANRASGSRALPAFSENNTAQCNIAFDKIENTKQPEVRQTGDLEQSVVKLQNFLIQKGLTSEEELQDFMNIPSVDIATHRTLPILQGYLK